MLQRIRMRFSTADTGRNGDTGPIVWGNLVGMSWKMESGDTGGGLWLSIVPQDTGAQDTGDGLLITRGTESMGGDFVKTPVQGGYHAGGTDTGAVTYMPYALAGDKLRAKVRQGDTGHLAGTLTFTISRHEHW